jgi:hypothetical protein
LKSSDGPGMYARTRIWCCFPSVLYMSIHRGVVSVGEIDLSDVGRIRLEERTLGLGKPLVTGFLRWIAEGGAQDPHHDRRQDQAESHGGRR